MDLSLLSFFTYFTSFFRPFPSASRNPSVFSLLPPSFPIPFIQSKLFLYTFFNLLYTPSPLHYFFFLANFHLFLILLPHDLSLSISHFHFSPYRPPPCCSYTICSGLHTRLFTRVPSSYLFITAVYNYTKVTFVIWYQW